MRFKQHIFSLLITLFFTSTVFSQLGGDDCVDATFICVTDVTTVADKTGGKDNSDAIASLSCSDVAVAADKKNVWYKVYAINSGLATIEVASNSADGHYFGVFESADSTCGTLSEVGGTCQLVTNAAAVDVDFAVTAGKMYYVLMEASTALNAVADVSADHNFTLSFKITNRAFAGHPDPTWSTADGEFSKCLGEDFTFTLTSVTETVSDSFSIFWRDATSASLNVDYWTGADTTVSFDTVFSDRMQVEGYNKVCVSYGDINSSTFGKNLSVSGVTTGIEYGNPMCIGTPSLFIGTATSGGDNIGVSTFEWTFDEEGSISTFSTVSDSFYFTPSQDTMHVKLKVTPLACAVDSIIDSTHEVNAAIEVNIDPTASICVGSVVNICTNPANGQVDAGNPYTYLWSPIGAADAVDRADSICTTITGMDVSDNGSQYEVLVTDTTGCIAKDTSSVIVTAAPSLDTTFNTLPTTCGSVTGWCHGSTVDIDYSITGGGAGLTVVRIYGDNRDSLAYTGGETYSFVIDSADTLLRFIAYDDVNCDDTIDLVVKTHDFPTMTSTEVCLTSPSPTSTLTAISSCAGAHSYLWSTTDGVAPNSNNVVSPIVDFTGQDPGWYSYSVQVTNAVTGCVQSATDSVFLDSLLDLSLNFTDSIFCQGDSADLVLIAGAGLTIGDLTIDWEQGVSANDSINIKPTTDSLVEISVTKGACQFNDTASVTFTPTPAAVIVFADTLCTCDTLTLDGTGSEVGGTISYDWESEVGQNLINDSTLSSTRVALCSADSFTLTVLNSVGNCSATVGKRIGTKSYISTTPDPDTVCVGANTLVAVTANLTGGNYSYSWKENDVPFGGGNKTENVIVNNQTTFSVVVTDNDWSCSFVDTVSVFTYIEPSISADPSGFCLGEPDLTSTITVSDVADTTEFDWTASAAYVADNGIVPSGVLNASSLDIDLVGQPAADYNFEVVITKTFGNCTYTRNSMIPILNNLDAIPNFTSDSSSCDGEAIVLEVSAPIADSFLWTMAAGTDTTLILNNQDTLDSVIISPYVTGGVATSYSYQVQTWLGTCFDRDTFNITALVLPTPLAKDTVVCSGDSAIIGYNIADSTETYSWSPITDLDNPNIARPTAGPLAGRDYILTITDSNNCTNTDTASIAVGALPSISWTLDATSTNCMGTGYCLGDGDITIAYNFDSDADPFEINWNISDSSVLEPTHSGAGQNGNLISNAIFKSDTSRFVKVIVVDSLGCTDSLETTLVRLRHSVTGSDICVTDNPPVSNFVISDYCGGTTDWNSLNADFAGVITPNDDESAVIDFTGMSPGTYNFVFATNDAGCLDTIYDSLSIGALFTASILPPTSTVICAQTTDSLTALMSGDPTGATMTWIKLPNDTIHLDTVKIGYTFTEDTDIELVIEKDACINRDTISYTVLDLPEPNWTTTKDTVCECETLALDGSASSNGAVYNWSSNQGNTMTNTNTNSAVVTLCESDSITFSVGNGTCTVDSGRVFVVNPDPNILASTSTDSICNGAATLVGLDGTGSDAGADYSQLWTASPAAISFDDATVVVANANVMQATTFTYTVTNDLTGCEHDTTLNIFIYDQSTIITSSGGSFCLNDNPRTETLTVSGEGAFSTYNWHITEDDSAFITSPKPWDGESIEVDVTAGGESTFTFRCIVGNTANGCDDTISIDIITAGSVNAQVNSLSDTICEGDTVILNGSGGANFVWSSSPADGSIGAQINDDTITVFPQGAPGVFTTYQYMMETFSGTCIDTVYIDIVVSPRPIVDAGGDLSTCSRDSISLGGSPTAGGGYSYSWNNALTLDDFEVANPKALPLVTTEYVVNAISPEGCSVSDTMNLTVNSSPTFSMTYAKNPFIDCNGNLGWCGSDTIAFDYSVTDGSGSYTYDWNNMVDLVSAIQGIHDGSSDRAFAESDSTSIYTLTVLDNITGCTIDTSLSFSKVRPGIAVEELCIFDVDKEATFTLSDYCSATFEWLGPNIGLLNSTSDSTVHADFTNQNSGEYDFTVVVDDALKFCKDTVRFTYTLDTFLNVSLSGVFDTVCGSISDTLIVTGDTADIHYTWVNLTSGDTLSGIDTPMVVVNPQSTANYEVIMNRAGCQLRDSFLVTVIPAPSIDVTFSTDVVCKCNSLTMDGSASESQSYITYLWQAQGSTVIAEDTAMVSTASLCVADTLSFTVTDSRNGCYRDTSVFVQVQDRPEPIFTKNIDSICRGDLTNIIVSAKATPGINKIFSWSVSPSGYIDNPNADSTFVTIDTQSVITVTVTDINTGCDSSYSDTVFIYPPADIGASADYICFDRSPGQQHPIVLSDFDPSNASVDWSISPDVSLIDGGAANYEESFIRVQVDTLSAGTYTFRTAIFNNVFGCPDTLEKNLIIRDSINVSLDPNLTIDSMCNGLMDTFTVDTTNILSIRWELSLFDNTIDSFRTNDSIWFMSDLGMADSMVNVMVIGENNGCLDSASHDVFLKGLASLFAGFDDTICQATSLDLADAFFEGGRISWTDEQIGAFLNADDIMNPIYVPDSTMDSNVLLIATVTDTFGICPAISDSIELFIQPRPIARVDKQFNTICTSDSLVFINVSSSFTDSVRWSDGGIGGTFSKADSVLENVYYPPRIYEPDSICLTLLVYGSNYCDVMDSQICFNVIQTPIAQFEDSIIDLCFMDTALLNETLVLEDNDSYSWSNTSSTGILIDTSDSLVSKYYNDVLESDQIIISINSGNGCSNQWAADTLITTIRPLPEIVVDSINGPDVVFFDSTRCNTEGFTFNATNNAAGAVSTFEWFKIYDGASDTTFFADTTGFLYDSADQVGLVTYYLVVKDQYNCMDTFAQEISIGDNPKPIAFADYIYEDCYPLEVDFGFTGVDEPIYSTFWDFGTGETSDRAFPSYIYKKDYTLDYPTNFYPTVTITYSNGCVNKDTVIVSVCEDFALPNIFSPNDDGVNDAFQIPGFNDLEGPCQLTVFNRWGQQVWYSPNYQNDWVGDMNVGGAAGKVLNPDIYYYIFACDGEVMWSGWVRIIATIENNNVIGN